MRGDRFLCSMESMPGGAGAAHAALMRGDLGVPMDSHSADRELAADLHVSDRTIRTYISLAGKK